MGINQSKQSKAVQQQQTADDKGSVKSESLTEVNKIRLIHGYEAYASGNEKRFLQEKIFTDEIFSAISDIGSLLHGYFVSLHPEDVQNHGKYVDQELFAFGGRKILELVSDVDQLNFYLRLFSNGKHDITRAEFLNLLSISEQSSWLSAGLSPTTSVARSDTSLEAATKNLFKNVSEVAVVDCHAWSVKHCPRMAKDLHAYVTSCLVADKTAFPVTARSASALVEMCKNGHSLVSLSSVWLLSCVLPVKFFPSPSSSHVISLSNISNIAQNSIWYVLYDSNSQGLGLNRFQHHVMDYTGATLLFISFDCYLYAVCIDSEWKESVHRWGGSDCAYFEIRPEYKVFQSGQNLIYFNPLDRAGPKGLHIGKDSRTTFLKVDDQFAKVSHYGVDYKLLSLEVWGCGGQEMLDALKTQKKWDQKEVDKHQNRKLVPEDWKDSPDRELLEMGGIQTDHAERCDI